MDLIKILLAHVLEQYFSHVGVTALLSAVLTCFVAQTAISVKNGKLLWCFLPVTVKYVNVV